MIPTIDSSNVSAFLDHVSEAGYSRGLLKRDYAKNPSGCYAGVPTYPEKLILADDDIAARLKRQQEDKASLYDLREANYEVLKSLDQNGTPLCWHFSLTKANMNARAIQGLPILKLSPWWGAGKLTNWNARGWWSSKAAEFAAQYGTPEYSFAPEFKRKYDTAETEANAEVHQLLIWYDLTDDRKKNWQIVKSAMVLGGAGTGDYNWLGHSMALNRLVDQNTMDDDNSWGATSQFGEKGLYRLTGSHAIPDGGVIVFGTEVSVK